MFTSIKNWLESHSLRSDAGVVRKERREARHMGRFILKEAQVGERVDHEFTSGERGKILKAFIAYRIIMTSEVKSLRTFIIGYKTLLRRAVENVNRLEQDIAANAHETHKQELLEMLKKMEHEILLSFQNFFQSLTSFESSSYTTQKLLDKSSQVRDLYYQAVQLRGPVKDLSRWIKHEESAERGGQTRDVTFEKKQYDLALNALRAELERHAKGLLDVILLLQEIQADINVKLQLIEDEVQQERYPKDWADKNRKEIAPVQHEIHDFIQRETQESRIFLSEVERAQG